MSLLDYIVQNLATVDLHDEALAEYIDGIIESEDLEEEEKRDGLVDFLKDATDKPTLDLVDDILHEYKARQKVKMKEKEEKKISTVPSAGSESSILITDSLIREKEKSSMSERFTLNQMSKEERLRRERLLQQYGYQLDEIVENEDGEAEIMYKDHHGSSAKTTDLLTANRNADIIKEKERTRREQMRKASEQEKERNKLLLERQRAAKEKEKQRTMKKEKRRL